MRLSNIADPSTHKMALLSQGVKDRITTVLNVGKTAFHWGFIPTIIYLGSDGSSESVRALCCLVQDSRRERSPACQNLLPPVCCGPESLILVL